MPDNRLSLLFIYYYVFPPRQEPVNIPALGWSPGTGKGRRILTEHLSSTTKAQQKLKQMTEALIWIIFALFQAVVYQWKRNCDTHTTFFSFFFPYFSTLIKAKKTPPNSAKDKNTPWDLWKTPFCIFLARSWVMQIIIKNHHWHLI